MGTNSIYSSEKILELLLDNSRTWKEEREYRILAIQKCYGTEPESDVINLP